MHVFVHKHPFASVPFDCNCLSNARVATIGGGVGEEGGVDNSGLTSTKEEGFGAVRGAVATESAQNSASDNAATPEVSRRNGAIPARWPSAPSASLAGRVASQPAVHNSIRAQFVLRNSTIRSGRRRRTRRAIGGNAAKMGAVWL